MEEQDPIIQNKLSELLLRVENSTLDQIPHRLKLFLDKVPKKDKTHYIWAVIYVIANECGFYKLPIENLENSKSENSDNTEFDTFPVQYTDGDEEIFKINLQLDQIIVDSSEKFKLIGYKNGETFILTFFSYENLKNNSSTYIAISTYIPVIHKTQIEKSFRHLDQLSIKVKDNLFLPVRNYFLGELGYLTPSLLYVDTYTFLNLMKYLSKKDTINLKLTCKKLLSRITNNV